MPITPQQIQVAEGQQDTAAQDMTLQVRLIAGPGSGKSRCIEKRVDHLLGGQVAPNRIFIISFTRASTNDLKKRIEAYCTQHGRHQDAKRLNISTMHSLALRALRRANLLHAFPADPMVLDDWEQENIFDPELGISGNFAPARAAEIREAYEAYWQTLQNTQLNPVTAQERALFNAYYPSMKNLYSCVLPGEMVRLCVDQIRLGALNPTQLLGIEHLIVDEFQDLNACDQEFVQAITGAGAMLWVAGDDDQSIYSFRHAAPAGIQNFPNTYPGSTTHQLEPCFRCAPAVLNAALQLIAANPGRLAKNLYSLYTASNPPVNGTLHVWRFATGGIEAREIASSCQQLIAAGMPAREILVLISNTRVQLPLIERTLADVGVAFARPKGPALRNSLMGRTVLSLLRIVKNNHDYIAHRSLLGIRDGVGPSTCQRIAQAATNTNLNFRDLFYVPLPGGVFTPRQNNALTAIAAVCQQLITWNLADTLVVRAQAIENFLQTILNSAQRKVGAEAVVEWRTIVGALPGGTTLDELLAYVWSDNEVEQLQIIEDICTRLGLAQANPAPQAANGRVRILTMHGSKGLDGRVVFIPGLEQNIMPARRALQSPGLLHERRRLLYMSITRARACCILTLARRRTGQQAFALANQPSVNQNPSDFLLDLGIVPQDRGAGLQAPEVTQVMADCANL
jgi:ATP-dependent DNA helicase UvrD/PcrA